MNSKKKFRYLTIPLCAALVLTTLTATASQPQQQPQMIHTTQYRGDVDGDGIVTIGDALQVLRHLVKLSSVAGEFIPVPTPDSWTWLDMMSVKHDNGGQSNNKMTPWNAKTLTHRKTYERGFYFETRSNDFQTAEFTLSGDYDTFIGVLVGLTSEYGSDNPATITFYGDNNLLYESPMISKNTADPVDFNVDVTGVQFLKIVIETSGILYYSKTGIVNARFERN